LTAKEISFKTKDSGQVKVIFKEREPFIGLFQPQINEEKVPLLLENFQVISAIKKLTDIQKIMKKKHFLPTYDYLILIVKGACSISMKR